MRLPKPSSPAVLANGPGSSWRRSVQPVAVTIRWGEVQGGHVAIQESAMWSSSLS